MKDERAIVTGTSMPAVHYADQPYVVKAKDGAWVMVVTTGVGGEGAKGQYVHFARSTDFGQTWETVPVESPDGPESSYAVLYVTEYGRIYCFYNHNTDNVRSVTARTGLQFNRVDSLGHFVFRYSDDNGKTWSGGRYDIPVRLFRVDREVNPTGGRIPFFWNVGKPLRTGEGVCVPLYKIGDVDPAWYDTEGVLLLCRNLETERDPEKLTWETLPDGEEGIRADRALYGHVSEEHSYVRLSDGTVMTVFRTVTGHPFCAYSTDEGHHFTEPEPLRYGDGSKVGHPRAANFIWKCENGKYLYWHHNHAGKDYLWRNPVFLSGGVEVDTPEGRRISLSEPEVLLYDPDPFCAISYPDLWEDGGAYYISETQKEKARFHQIDKTLLETLWQDAERRTLPEGGELLSDMLPVLPAFARRIWTFPMYKEEVPVSFALSFAFTQDGKAGEVLSAMERMVGIRLTTDGERLLFFMSDGFSHFALQSPALSKDRHQVAVLIDGGAHVCRFVLDGAAVRPTEEEPTPFGMFDRNFTEVAKGQPLWRRGDVENLRLYRELVTAPQMAMIQRGIKEKSGAGQR